MSDRLVTVRTDATYYELEQQRDLVLMFKELMEDIDSEPIDELDFKAVNQLLELLDNMLEESTPYYDTYAGALSFAES